MKHPTTELSIHYPDLPVSRRKEEIIAAMRAHQVVVVVGDTGSGKTTQLPKMALELDRESPPRKGAKRQRIGCTQPRRIAASSVAKRVSEELGAELGALVGYQVRFQETLSKEAPIKFMTDGILLAESQGDPLLRQYHTLIIDEAHERSLNIDFVLGYLRELMPRRPDLRVVISSATLDAERFSDFFGGAPIVEVEGRTFPVSDYFLPEEEDEDLPRHVLRGVEWVNRYDPRGDVLIFLPGERDIRLCADALEARKYAGVEILPLYARLSLGDQQRVFSSSPHRRIVLATNVAETSLTIPGIVYVIDSGLVKMSRYLPARGIQRLQDERISLASARQRRGRCGRVREGVCLKLYSEEEENLFPEYTDPEIKRSSLAGVILRMKSLGLPEIRNFPLIDPPSPKAVREGEQTLDEIGALEPSGALSEIGSMLARLPLDPRLGRMLVAGWERKVESALTQIVAGMSVMDVRERPTDKAGAADIAHGKFRHLDSDFLSLLRIWSRLQEYRVPGGKGWKRGALRTYCKKNFLSFRRVLEWEQVSEELRQLQKDQFGWKVALLRKSDEEWGDASEIHKALFSGIPMQVGRWDREKRFYRGAGGREFSVFPGSGLFGKQYPEWVLVHELVETSKLWARKVAKFEPKWIEELVPWSCRYRYHSPYWDEQQGTVYGKENVLYGGLLIAENRSVYYGKVNPKEAHLIFANEAVVGGQMRGIERRPFMKNFLAVKEEILLIEQKLRKVGHFWQEQAALDFFFAKIPGHLHSAKDFLHWLQEDKNEAQLMVRQQDLIWQEPEGLELFPNTITVGEESYPVYYRTDPGARDDGVCFGVHLDQLGHFPEHLMSWGVPGIYADRAETMIRSLQKDFRTACQPIRETALDFALDWHHWEPQLPMELALAEFLAERTGYEQLLFEDLLGARWEEAKKHHERRMPEEWRPKVWIYDDRDQEVAFGTDFLQLKEELSALIAKRQQERANEKWAMTGATVWDFGEIDELPEQADACYPALVDEKKSVGLSAFLTAEEALWSHRRGCARLFRLQEPGAVEYLEKHLPLDPMVKLSLGVITREQGRFLSEMITLSIEGALGTPLPRSAATFANAAQQARGELFVCAQSIAAMLGELIESHQIVMGWCEQNLQHRYFSEVAEDLQEEISFLTQRYMMGQFAYARLTQLHKYFHGMEERILKLGQQAFVREEERLALFRPYWTQWYEEWSGSKGARKQVLHAVGERLEDWRMLLFAPGRPKVVQERVTKREIHELFLEKGLGEPT